MGSLVLIYQLLIGSYYPRVAHMCAHTYACEAGIPQKEVING